MMTQDKTTEYSTQEDDFIYLDDPDEGKTGFFKLLIIGFIILLAVGGVSLLGWVFYQGKTISLEETPIIKAEQTPTKVKPEEPGGMVVANMDKTVYDSLSRNNDAPQTAEKILPAPEEPIDRIQVINGAPKPEIGADDAAGIPPAAPSEPVEGKVELPAAPAQKSSPDALSEAVRQNNNDGVRPLMESDLKLVPDTHAPKSPQSDALPPSTQDNSSSSGYKIQLAAFKSEKDALEAWKKIQSSHTDLLGKLRYSIERKDVEGKGTFYRLQAGSFSKQSDARLLCKKLAEVNQGCFVAE